MTTKVTSEDCVKFIMSDTRRGEAYRGVPEDWKRRSKRNVRGLVVRVFQNVKTGETVMVAEKDGKLSETGDIYLYAIWDNPDKGEECEPDFHIWVTNAADWAVNHRVDDRGIPGDVEQKLQAVGVYGCMEGCFEPADGMTKDEARKAFEALGFVNDKGFQEFIEEDGE